MNWSRFLPIFEQVQGYTLQTFQKDFSAGLTVCIMLIPQGMAYALLAGMPPIYGLYGGLVPLFLYGIFGTSRQVSIGPVAVSALLVLAGISQLAEPESADYVKLVILTGFLIGLFQLLLGGLRMGFLVTFLSKPILMGFTSAAAIIIAVSQLKYLFGFPIPNLESTYETLVYAVEHIHETNWLSFIFCVSSILVMLALKRWAPFIPDALLVSILGIIITYVFRFDLMGLSIVGTVPEGLPDFGTPDWQWDKINMVWPTVLTVGVIGFVESISIAKVMEAKNKDTKVRPNQELFALGISKLLGAFFQAIPSSASFTRSAVNNEAGAKTGLASIIAAIATGLTLVFLTPLFFYLPKAVLAAIVLMAVRSLFEIHEAIELWHTHRKDFFMLLITFLATIILGIEEGVLTGVVLSLLLVIYQSSRPHVAILGRLPGTPHFRNIERFPEAQQFDGIIIVRFDSPLFFLNVEQFKDSIEHIIEQHDDEVKLVILDASSILDIDSSGLDGIKDIHKFLVDNGIQLFISGMLGQVRDTFQRSGLMEKIGAKKHFMYINDALYFYQSEEDEKHAIWTDHAIQYNLKNKKKK
jgi:SulP family sulfate permease